MYVSVPGLQRETKNVSAGMDRDINLDYWNREHPRLPGLAKNNLNANRPRTPAVPVQGLTIR